MFERAGSLRVTGDKKKRQLPEPIFKILSKSSAILDVGCGNGWLTEFVNKEKYCGISFSEPEIKNLKDKGYEGMVMDIETDLRLFPSDTFDCIFASHVIEHFEKSVLIKVMKQFNRILKKGGKIILLTPTEFSIGFYGEWSHVRPYNHDSLPGLLSDFDYQNIDWFYPKLYKWHKKMQRYGRFLLPMLRFNHWNEVYAIGTKA